MQQLSIKEGDWVHSLLFSEVHTAKQWGMTPSEFRALHWQDQIEMVGCEVAVSKMQTYDRQVAEAEAETARRRGGR